MTPERLARRIVDDVLARASHADPDPAVRAAAESELLARHADRAAATRRAGEEVGLAFHRIADRVNDAYRPLREFFAALAKGLEP